MDTSMMKSSTSKTKRKRAKHGGGASGQQTKKQRADPQTPATLGGDELDDFQIPLEDVDQNAQEEEGVKSGTDQGADGKVGAADDRDANEPSEEANETAKRQRNKKLKERLKAKKASKHSWEEGRKIAADICSASDEEKARWLWESYSAVTGSSQIERGGLEETCMGNLGKGDGLEAQLCATRPKWRELLSDMQGHPNGSPLVLLLASSAASANELAKKLPNLNNGCKIAKLFAKHFKVGEQQQALQSACINIATGTPNRMDKLADEGSLRLGRLQLVVLDVVLDAKQRCLLDIPEVCKDLWTFFTKHLKPLTAAGKTKIALIDSSILL